MCVHLKWSMEIQNKSKVFGLKCGGDEEKPFPPLLIFQTADFSGLLMLYKCRSTHTALQREIPAEMVEIMFTAGTSYRLLYFTMHALHITFSAPLTRVILEFVCEQQPDHFLTFHTLYTASGFHQLCHRVVKDNQRGEMD